MRTRAARIMRWATMASSGLVLGGIGLGGGCLRDNFFVDIISDTAGAVVTGIIANGLATVGIVI